MKEITVNYRINLGYGNGGRDRDFTILEDDWEAMTKRDFDDLLNEVAGEYIDWNYDEGETSNGNITIHYTISNGYVGCGVDDSFEIDVEEWEEMDEQEQLEFVKEYYIDERVELSHKIEGASYDDLPDGDA